jgi:hypothetical protein
VLGYAEILQNGHRVPQPNVLKSPRKTQGGDFVGTKTGNALTQKTNPAFGGPVEAGDQIKNGGFTRSVGSYQTQKFPFFEAQIEIMNGLQTAEKMSQVLDFK